MSSRNQNFCGAFDVFRERNDVAVFGHVQNRAGHDREQVPYAVGIFRSVQDARQARVRFLDFAEQLESADVRAEIVVGNYCVIVMIAQRDKCFFRRLHVRDTHVILIER